MSKFDEAYWTSRYLHQQTGWDIGRVSTPLKRILDGISNREIKLLIPGAGNAWEAEYAFNQGFRNVTVLDFAQPAIDHFLNRLPSFPKEQVIHADFFEHEGQYDLILEQTFFCALHPSLRENYALKMHELLSPKGELRGLLFNATMSSDSPPFGGTTSDYQALFESHFSQVELLPCLDSIPPRAGKEITICLKK